MESPDLDILAKPDPIDDDCLANLGPLAALAGTWEGDAGLDRSATPEGPVDTSFRERMTLEPVGPVVNGPQVLYGLRYATTAWPLGSDAAFHEETGYWLWDPRAQTVMRCFMVPRAVNVLAGGQAAPRARSFRMTAEAGSEAFGILNNPFLNEATRTVRYEVEVTVHVDGSFSYAEDTVLRIAGHDELFHHEDSNTLRRS